jgi:hypothetical protein
VEEAFFETALGGEYFTHLKIIGSGKNKSYGIVTFSKFPIISKGEIIHPGSSSLSIYTDVLIQNDTFRIYNNHLQSFRLMRMERSFINELTASDDKETMTEVKSLSLSLKKGFVKRANQAIRLLFSVILMTHRYHMHILKSGKDLMIHLSIQAMVQVLPTEETTLQTG